MNAISNRPADELHCGICGDARPRASCHIVRLTDEEGAILGTDDKECVYCKPCWRTLSNPLIGASLTKGLLLARLRRLGVGDAEKIAERYHAKLVSRIKARPS
jgi:NAD-dependent dihydropyrimidine dehydrogenase PreA subunit